MCTTTTTTTMIINTITVTITSVVNYRQLQPRRQDRHDDLPGPRHSRQEGLHPGRHAVPGQVKSNTYTRLD